MPKQDKKAKQKPHSVLRPPQNRKVRGRGDYEVEPTPTGISSALSRIESKVDKAANPNVRSAASSVGRALGSLVPLPGASELGAAAGDWLAKAFGHGDYQIVSNSLIPNSAGKMEAASQPVEFSRNGKRGTRIMEREYVMDLVSSASANTFSNQTFRVNPADQITFPWLSTIALGWDEYEINGMIFEFKSTSSEFNATGQTLGSVIMATEYDVLDQSFQSKMSMENADYSNSCKTADCMLHGLECARDEQPTKVLYCARNTPTTGDLRLYDFANFQIASFGVSSTNVVLGEIWVSYDITFWKKELNAGQVGASQSNSQVTTLTGISGTNFFGVNSLNTGTFKLTHTSGTTLAFPPNIQTGVYQVVFQVFGTGLSGLNILGSTTFTNCAVATTYPIGQAANFVSATAMNGSLVLQINAANATMTFPSFSQTTVTQISVVVSQLPPSSSYSVVSG